MGSFTSRQQYKYGVGTVSYFDRHIFSDDRTREMFQAMKLSRQRALRLFRAFVRMDTDRSGQIGLTEFHRYFGIRRTTFTERVFGLLDADQNDNLSFHEVAVGVWNFCTFDSALLAKFAWDIFDIDELGWLSVDELDALVRMVFNEKNANTYSMEKIRGASSEGGMAFEAFASLVEDHPEILKPAFGIQRSLRKKLFGEKYWDQRSRIRVARFGMGQIPFGTSWDSVSNRLTSSDAVCGNKVKEDVTEPSVLKPDELPLVSLPEERREDRLRKKLHEVESRLQAEFTIDEVNECKELRQQLWKLFDDTENARYDTLDAQEERELGGGSPRRGDEIVSQKLGEIRANSFFFRAAPLIRGSNSSRRQTKPPPRRASKDEIHEKFHQLRNCFEEEWKKLSIQYEESFGHRQTSWERLFDTEKQRRFFFNWRTGERCDEQDAAICESCDGLLAGDDFKCLVCGSERSEINKKRYKGRLPLNEMVKADKKAHIVPG